MFPVGAARSLRSLVSVFVGVSVYSYLSFYINISDIEDNPSIKLYCRNKRGFQLFFGFPDDFSSFSSKILLGHFVVVSLNALSSESLLCLSVDRIKLFPVF